MMEFDEKLVEVLLKYPVVWNRKLKQFRNPQVKENTWKLIADEMNTTVENIHRRYMYLRERNRKEKSYEKNPNTTSEREPWYLREKCRFLDQVQLSRNRLCLFKVRNSSTKVVNDNASYDDTFSMDSFSESSPSVKNRTIDDECVNKLKQENRTLNEENGRLDDDEEENIQSRSLEEEYFIEENVPKNDDNSAFASYVNSLMSPLPVQARDELQTNIITMIMKQRRKYL